MLLLLCNASLSWYWYNAPCGMDLNTAKTEAARAKISCIIPHFRSISRHFKLYISPQCIYVVSFIRCKTCNQAHSYTGQCFYFDHDLLFSFCLRWKGQWAHTGAWVLSSSGNGCRLMKSTEICLCFGPCMRAARCMCLALILGRLRSA